MPRPPASDPYEVLGVSPEASPAEVRRAYLALARRLHPDVGGEEADRMAAVNAAWEVLSDPAARTELDRRRRQDAQATHVPGTPSADFVPYDDGDDPEDPAAEHDVPIGDGSRPARSLQLGPAALLVVGLFALAVGLAISFPPLLVLGIVGVVAAGVLFLGAPFWVVMHSHRTTRDDR